MTKGEMEQVIRSLTRDLTLLEKDNARLDKDRKEAMQRLTAAHKELRTLKGSSF